MEDGIESRTGAKLPAGEDGEEIELSSEDEDENDENEVTAEYVALAGGKLDIFNN